MDNLDAFIARHKAILSAAPSQQAPTNCRHCGGPDRVLCAGQCKAKQPAKDIGVEQDERVFARIAAMKAAQQDPTAQGEPVGELRSDEFEGHIFVPYNGEWPFGKPLYTHPQQASEPMTDEQIRARCKHDWTFETVRQWVRITEQFHNIKGKQ
jgi:hypothetical protein